MREGGEGTSSNAPIFARKARNSYLFRVTQGQLGAPGTTRQHSYLYASEKGQPDSASPDRGMYEKESRAGVEPRVEGAGREGVECAREAGLAHHGGELVHEKVLVSRARIASDM